MLGGFTERVGGSGTWAVCEDLIAASFGANYTNYMAPRTVLLSVFLAATAALVPVVLADEDVHAAQPESVSIEAGQSADAPAVVQNFAPATEPADNTVSPADPVPAEAPAPAEASATVESASVERAVGQTAVQVVEEPTAAPEAVEPEQLDPVMPAPTAEPVVSEPVAAEPVVAEPVTDEPASVEPAVPAAVAGYSIGDLAPQTAGASVGSAQTAGQAMLPADIDVDLSSDMVEILVPSVGQGAMFPAELDADYSTDMVAIIIPDGEPFPAAG